ncbi:FKBP-type peptidyl-prolyl cis-trans isomerase [Mucilaginibacter phyllosphaerae]|uniref:peptidylprolyl isomerase n=1 Tax=Mucilaginibacter phyllosphaerae TaxID=1812349 RepID=A0A4Y8AK52_9SPHI|nr:hypothetical protein [Mucilaginibacter phyllosphaerae]MBB3967529.1 FKBP-type peptidyl-prolyl cis-trans isomerase [Mucilaginibacter phyllosphaerae]TEW69410.1 hypothetical protein E2R65_04370 [Mucilaginibacter phyllosphaerae]GGH21227.1 hypothetical protein GCM10007352_33790 [Mucilaginibacter phyllosphaerae]
MKQKIFTFLLIAAAGLSACKKLEEQPTIKVFDDQQIQSYVAANSIAGLTKDENSGIYYKVLSQTTSGADSIKYSDEVLIVYTVKTLDGKYVSSDTIANHFYSYLGQLSFKNATTGFGYPIGLQLAIHDLLRYKGSMRLLIPSNLAYGVNGFGTGSVTNTNTRIGGNQSLDYYVNVIKDQNAYDDQVIKNYIAAKNLTGFVKDPLGYYYKINTQPTGTIGEIKDFSNVTATYQGYLLNDVAFDINSVTSAATLVPFSLVDGVKDAMLKHVATGTNITLLIPSSLGYGLPSSGVPPASILKFDFNVTGVTQP